MLLWQTNTLYTSPAPLVCGGGDGSTRQTTANVGSGGRCMSPDDEASVASLSTVSDIHLKSRDEFNNQVSESGNGPFLMFDCSFTSREAAWSYLVMCWCWSKKHSLILNFNTKYIFRILYLILCQKILFRMTFSYGRGST